MANAYGVNYTKAVVNGGISMTDALSKRTPVWRQDTFEASSTASGTTVYMARIPANHAIVSGFLLRDALGSSVTLAVGDGTTADRFLAATASNTANLNTALTIAVDDCGAPLSTTADTDIVITVGGAAATGTIKLLLNVIAV